VSIFECRGATRIYVKNFGSGLLTRKSDFALSQQVYKTNNIFCSLKWAGLMQNCTLKSDMQRSLYC